MESFEIELPTSVYVGKKKHMINYNAFISKFHIVKNDIKQNYQDIIIELLPDVKYGKIEVEFTLYRYNYLKSRKRLSKQIIDKSNVQSIANKFFLDALVKKGIIEDDNDNFVKKETTHPTVDFARELSKEDEKIIFKVTNIGE